jgi:hypothetical protein
VESGPDQSAKDRYGTRGRTHGLHGTLVLDMYDPGTKQLVWTGNATKTLDPSGNQEKNMKNLNKAMQKLLKNYPPK